MRLIFFLFLFSIGAFGQKMQTFTYFENDTLNLKLDLYLPKNQSQKIPLVLYVHGGGFSGGERESGKAFCEELAKNGYAAATISYTLYMKNKNFSCDGVTSEKIKAIQYSVNDLWLATNFMISKAKTFNLDEQKIFISGSSAGGETALHAAYWDRQYMRMYEHNLPESFKYAGLISGAGALMDLNLITKSNEIPMFFFHGNGDSTVPYATAAHHYCKTNASGWLMLFGSHSLYEQAIQNDATAVLYTYCGGGHEYSGILFEKEQAPIISFLNDVRASRKVQHHSIIKTGKSNALSAAFHFCD